jgi:ketosteroid isomerase-like protein
MYEAFGRGDVDAVLQPLADDVDWVAVPGSDAAPWFGTYRGKAEVPRFFGAIVGSVDVTEFTPLSITSNETDVIVAIQWGYRVQATGKTASMVMYHWWRFDDGRVVSVRTAEDTQQAVEAFAS